MATPNSVTRRLKDVEKSVADSEREAFMEAHHDDINAYCREAGVTPLELVIEAERLAVDVLARHEAGMSAEEIADAVLAGLDPSDEMRRELAGCVLRIVAGLDEPIWGGD